MDLTVLDKSINEILEEVYDEWVWIEPVKGDSTQLTKDYSSNNQEDSME